MKLAQKSLASIFALVVVTSPALADDKSKIKLSDLKAQPTTVPPPPAPPPKPSGLPMGATVTPSGGVKAPIGNNGYGVEVSKPPSGGIGGTVSATKEL